MQHRHYLLLLLSFLTLPHFGQHRVVQHKPFIDQRPWHYGFYVGFHDQGLKLSNSGWVDPESGGQWTGENDRQNFGFTVGVVGDWRLSQYLSLRLTPGLHFGSKHLSFRSQQTGKYTTQDLKTTYISAPLDLKIAGPRFNNYRPYVVAGGALMVDLTTAKGAHVRTKPFQPFLSVGLGCDFYLPFFKLIPELKFNFGLTNVLRKDRPDLTDASQRVYTNALDGARPNLVQLTFYFE